MACSSCGKNSSSRVGNTLNTAIIFGDPTNEVHRARVIDDIPGMQTGSIKYVRGSMVQQLVDEGKLALLAGQARILPTRTSPYTLYYVGDIGYTTIEAARVRSGQVGLDIQVRTLGQ